MPGEVSGGHHAPVRGGEDWEMLTHLGVGGLHGQACVCREEDVDVVVVGRAGHHGHNLSIFLKDLHLLPCGAVGGVESVNKLTRSGTLSISSK